MSSDLLAAEDDIVGATSAKASTDYHRPVDSTGAFQVETYTFGEGGFCGGSSKDNSIDKMTFIDVARDVAPSLASQNYIPSRDTKTTKFLIMVYWGTTSGAAGANNSAAYQNLASAQSPDGIDDSLLAMVLLENHRRDSNNIKNARVLGYDEELASALRLKGTALDYRRRDLINEVEDNRYFVVLMAYDFHLLLNEKKHKLVWETRFSVPESGHEFSKDLKGMAFNSAKFFGQNTHGIVRKPLPTGHVEIGPIKSLGPIPNEPAQPK